MVNNTMGFKFVIDAKTAEKRIKKAEYHAKELQKALDLINNTVITYKLKEIKTKKHWWQIW